MADPRLSNYEMSLEEYINWNKRSSEYAFLREIHFKQKIVPILNSLVKDINTVDDF